MNKASVVLLIFLLGMATIGEVGAVNEAAMNFLKCKCLKTCYYQFYLLNSACDKLRRRRNSFALLFNCRSA